MMSVLAGKYQCNRGEYIMKLIDSFIHGLKVDLAWLLYGLKGLAVIVIFLLLAGGLAFAAYSINQTWGSGVLGFIIGVIIYVLFEESK